MHVLHEGLGFDQVMAPLPDGDQAILVTTPAGVRAWRNRCPHVGVGLDWGDGRCLVEPNVLLCAMHGARFEADSGDCTDGPCAGDRLSPIPIRIDGDRVVLA
jgi:nitrite reductase/ring-hydroxylating ferredoxin subunit